MVRRAVAVVASAAVVLATGVAWATLRDLTQGITTSSALSGTHAVAPSEDGSVNVLLMGLDSRKDLFDADNRHPEAAEAVGAGALLALTPGKGIQAHREANGVLHTYVAVTKPEEWISNIDFTDVAGAKVQLADEFQDWAPELTALITAADTALVPRPIYTLPIWHRWQRTPGVTLLGDAAHLMPPSGEGANLAMFDGSELAQAIASHPDDIESALAAYEQPRFPRSVDAAAESTRIFKLLVAENAPQSMLDFLTNHDPTQ